RSGSDTVSQLTPLTSSNAAPGPSSAGLGSPHRSTTGSPVLPPAPAQAIAPGGLGSATVLRGSAPGVAGSWAGRAASSAEQSAPVASGASTGGSASGRSALGAAPRWPCSTPSTTAASSNASGSAYSRTVDGPRVRTVSRGSPP